MKTSIDEGMNETAARGTLVGGCLKGLRVIGAFDFDRQCQSIADIACTRGQDRATSSSDYASCSS